MNAILYSGIAVNCCDWCLDYSDVCLVMVLGILMVMQRLTMKSGNLYIVCVWTVITSVYIGEN